MGCPANINSVIIWNNDTCIIWACVIDQGTSPSIVYAGGKYQPDLAVSYGHNLWVWDYRSGWLEGGPIESGTSPSMTLCNGYPEVAYNSSGSGAPTLWVWGNRAQYDTGALMMSGTSPSIAQSTSSDDLFRVAFQDNSKHLSYWTVTSGHVQTTALMDGASNPSIASMTIPPL
jgi:hypothetical protein